MRRSELKSLIKEVVREQLNEAPKYDGSKPWIITVSKTGHKGLYGPLNQKEYEKNIAVFEKDGVPPNAIHIYKYKETLK